MSYQEKAAQNFDLLKSKFYTVYLFYKKKIKYAISLLVKGKKERKGGLNIYLSKNEINGLEISVKVGCGLFCEYCPQDNYIKNYKSRYEGQPKMLS